MEFNFNLENFKNEIMKLPLKNKFTKEELLKEDFLIAREDNIDIYYMPRTIEKRGSEKIVILGITPGFQQMSSSYVAARMGLEEEKAIEEIEKDCNRAGVFATALRNNLISMMDELHINEKLSINSTKVFFEENSSMAYNMGLLYYPVFVKGKNYTGHSPKIIKSPFLMNIVRDNFIKEIKGFDDLLIIPLGKSVEEVLELLIEEGLIKREKVLWGFPHPSGANVNRKTQFEANKMEMLKIINNVLN